MNSEQKKVVQSSELPEHFDRVTVAAPIPEVRVAIVSTLEMDGRGGLDPTRYGDWEKNGRCIDF